MFKPKANNNPPNGLTFIIYITGFKAKYIAVYDRNVLTNQ